MAEDHDYTMYVGELTYKTFQDTLKEFAQPPNEKEEPIDEDFLCNLEKTE